MGAAAKQISDQMWSLWPRIFDCYNEWAQDYFENIMVPLDNFISNGTERFLSGQDPNYLQQVRNACPCPLPACLCAHKDCRSTEHCRPWRFAKSIVCIWMAPCGCLHRPAMH